VVSMLASGTFGGLVVSVLASGTFGGLVVSMLASGTQDRGFAPGRSRRIFLGEKFLSIPSFGREVKPFASCRRFAAYQRSLNDVRIRRHFGKITRPFSPTVPTFVTESSRVYGDVEASGDESGNF
jgi:hypothetical protein